MTPWIFRCLGVIAVSFVVLVAAVAMAAAKYIETTTRDLVIATCIIVALFVIIPMLMAVIIRHTVRGIATDVQQSFKHFRPELLGPSIAEAQAKAELEEAMRKSFLKSDQVTAYKWDRCRDCVIFIYEKLTMKDALCHLAARGHPGTAPEGVTSRRDAFDMINNSLPEKKQFEFLGSIDEPEPCDVYVPPEVET